MKCGIDLLESRRLLSAQTADYSTLIRDEQTFPSIFTTTNHQEAVIRGAIHSDLVKLRVYNKADATALVALTRDEAADITHARKDLLTLEVLINHDSRNLIVRGSARQQFSTNPIFLNAFSAALAKFEQDESNSEQKIAADLTSAVSGASLTQLQALAAADPTAPTLQSDVQAGAENLQLFSISLNAALDNYNVNCGTLVNDSTGIAVFGAEDFFGEGYPASANPYQGATLTGLGANTSTVAISKFVAPALFAPTSSSYPGTDQIYVGSGQIPGTDQVAGPQVISLDYSALTKLGHPIETFTLGIATDGFENPTINIPYTVSVNGVVNTQLTAVLNSLNDADRVEQFVSIGIDPSLLSASKVLTLSIDSPGNDVSGWAVDFLTVGIQNG